MEPPVIINMGLIYCTSNTSHTTECWGSLFRTLLNLGVLWCSTLPYHSMTGSIISQLQIHLLNFINHIPHPDKLTPHPTHHSLKVALKNIQKSTSFLYYYSYDSSMIWLRMMYIWVLEGGRKKNVEDPFQWEYVIDIML